jgi:hypothetical protein
MDGCTEMSKAAIDGAMVRGVGKRKRDEKSM